MQCVRRAPNWRFAAGDLEAQCRDHEKNNQATRLIIGRTDIGDSRGRRRAAWGGRRGGRADMPDVDVHIFVDGGNEAVGGREKQRVHLHALRKSDAGCCGEENCGDGGSGSRGGDRVGDGGDLGRADWQYCNRAMS